MIDDIVRFGAYFDWISPLLTIAQDVANGPSHTLMIPQDCGWTGREITNLLKRRGVQSWGHMVVNGTLMINVRQTQARWAQYLLQRAGIPLAEQPDPPDPRRTGSPSGPEPEPAAEGLGDVLKDIGELRIF